MAADPSETSVRLPFRAPLDFDGLLSYLAAREVQALERVGDGTYTRAMSAPGGPARVSLSADGDRIRCDLKLADQRDLANVVPRVRRLLDLDADPVRIDGRLGTDPALARLVAKHPGLRSPGAVDGFEIAVRGIIGQQVSVRAARTRLQGIVAEHGAIAFPGESLRLFPAPARFAAIDPGTLRMPQARARSLIALAEAAADGRLALGPDSDHGRERAGLLALPGIGPWTADYICMRAMGDTDILLATDLGVRRSAERHGVDLSGGRPDLSPWRSYVSNHLWAASH
jgi:AraC family transcriptional regulator of adaptative response / DNA-3-methyladenine glycosylase II